MIYIKLDEDMCLTITRNEPIFRGDVMSRRITYLIPQMVGDIDMLTATVYLSYIRADGTADIVLLKRSDEKYNENYFQYTLPITSTLSRYAGEVCTWLQIYSGPPRHPVIAKSRECVLQILASKNMDEYISDRNLSLIYMMQRHMEDKIEKTETLLEERIDAGLASKADNIIFHEEDSTIQLVSTKVVTDEEGNEEIQQIPLGDRIFVRADTNANISDAGINDSGELVIYFDDETTKNLGRVVGKDGAVYVPHLDVRKVLSFTVEDAPVEPPEPVDLNPFDEWSGINDGDEASDYIWEDM